MLMSFLNSICYFLYLTLCNIDIIFKVNLIFYTSSKYLKFVHYCDLQYCLCDF